MCDCKMNYFNFKEFGDKYLLTNDTGRFLFLSKGEINKFIQNDYEDSPELFNKLAQNYFAYNKHRELFVDEVSSEVRRQKGFLFEGTQLHIFVLTRECNQQCIYCQASAKAKPCHDTNMSAEIAENAVDIAFQSPSKNLTFEFQGGEPLLNFPILKLIVEYAKAKNIDGTRNISFNLVSNIIKLDDSMLEYLVKNNISICTSLDGHESLHILNRPCGEKDYYSKIIKNISKINKTCKDANVELGRVQAIQTTTRHSLRYAKEIVDEYISQGFNSVFIRPLTPLGFAKERWDKVGYTPEEFLSFYKASLEYIMELAIKGVNIRENYATILLKKILGHQTLNYMELRSPCGGAIGQLAYNYDGGVYTCDEGRMLAEAGDESFKLGNVFESSYKQLIESTVTEAICISSCLETIPGCQECVYSPYCGVCPIFNYVQEGSIFALMSDNYKCKINKGIIDFLFNKIFEAI